MSKDYILIPRDRLEILKKHKEWIERLEKLGNVKIEINEEIVIESKDPLSIIRAKNVLRAFGRRFDFETCLNLLDDEYRLEIINVSEYSKSKNRQRELKGRVIGSKGKMKKAIEYFTNTKIAVYGKSVSIIGRWEDVEIARKAIEMILNGAMHQTVYKFLEEHRTM
ncbi:MAG: RNA-processing protein [Candidatus Aenigmarchaeota archaeon]|nr:RNA-processing protein [Candidatus Aenigmarchaeota archaeon]